MASLQRSGTSCMYSSLSQEDRERVPKFKKLFFFFCVVVVKDRCTAAAGRSANCSFLDHSLSHSFANPSDVCVCSLVQSCCTRYMY